MSRTALAFSPHLDDAAFSCGGTLAMLAENGWRVLVATAFTASVPDPQGFALACQLDKGLSADIDYMALRRAEDRDAMRALGVEPPVWLPFPEAPHRGYESAQALFEGVHDGDGIEHALGPAFRQLIEAHRPALLLAPQAVGGHVDHILVVRAFRSAAAAGACPVLWWTDFPYAVRADAPRRPFSSAMAALDEAEVRVSEACLSGKRKACRAYASQIGFQFGGAEGLDRRLAEAGDAEAFRRSGAMPL